jgi:hypothetical protein
MIASALKKGAHFHLIQGRKAVSQIALIRFETDN